MLAGIPVIADPGIPTGLGSNDDEDAVVAFYSPEMLLYESPIMVMTGQPGLKNWTTTITLGKFAGFAPQYSESVAKATGTSFNEV